MYKQESIKAILELQKITELIGWFRSSSPYAKTTTLSVNRHVSAKEKNIKTNTLSIFFINIIPP
jgi:hypothetical protein